MGLPMVKGFSNEDPYPMLQPKLNKEDEGEHTNILTGLMAASQNLSSCYATFKNDVAILRTEWEKAKL